jgi:hypothetical protein
VGGPGDEHEAAVGDAVVLIVLEPDAVHLVQGGVAEGVVGIEIGL